MNCHFLKRQHQIIIVASFWISSGSRLMDIFFFYKRIAITEVTKEMMPAVLNGALLKTGKKIHNEINLNKKRYEVYKETVSIEKFYLTLHSYINQFMKTCKMKSYL